MTMPRWLAVALPLGLGVPAPAAAQDTVIVARPGRSVSSTRQVAREAVRLFNAADVRLYGPTTVGSRDVYAGDVGALDGPLTIDGEIRGRLVAINADVELLAGARIRGDVLVMGGTLEQDPAADIAGNVQVNGRRVVVRRQGDAVELVGESAEPVRRSRLRRTRYVPRGHASITLGSDGTYNRVEGLPYRIGPRIDWEGPTSGRIEALAIFRTAAGFSADSDAIGYRVNGRLGSGWGSPIEFGGAAYDLVAPTESWQLGDDEVSLAALLFRRDYRDYYLKRGVAGWLTLRPMRSLELTGEIARDQETSIGARDVWTPFRQDQPWRPNPAIDDGHFTHLTGRLEYDSRRSGRWSGSGWLLRGEWERGFNDDAQLRGPYDRVFADLRRYQQIGWSGELRLRAVAAGTAALDRDLPLPIQRRLSLGGPEPMPGYPFRQFACNVGDVAPAMCDRLLLFQAEYRGDLSFGLFDYDHGWKGRPERGAHPWQGSRSDHDDVWFEEPRFVLLANAGSAWVHPNRPSKLSLDLGAGLEFGSVGIYAARAVEAGAPFRFTLRLRQRF